MSLGLGVRFSNYIDRDERSFAKAHSRLPAQKGGGVQIPPPPPLPSLPPPTPLARSKELLNTVDSPQIEHPPNPSKPVAFRACPTSGPHAVGWCSSASVAAKKKTRHFEGLSDLRAANCSHVSL
jgi:hypothetical protein